MIGERCAECGRIASSGTWKETSQYDKSRKAIFICLSCEHTAEEATGARRKADLEEFNRSIMELADKKAALAQEREKQKPIILSDILRKNCPISDWYRLTNITHEFQTHYPNAGRMLVSNLLFRLGFTQRDRKKRGSYTYVYIDPTKIPGLA